MQFSILVSVAVFLSSTNALVIPTIEKRNYNVSSIANVEPFAVDPAESATIASLNSTSTGVIPHKYIVVLKNQLSDNDVQGHKTWVAQKRSLDASSNSTSDFLATLRALNSSEGIVSEFNIGDLIKGYSGYFSDDTIKELELSPAVSYIEQDALIDTYGAENNVYQPSAPWNLARISSTTPLKQQLTKTHSYVYDKEAGEGVTCYIIDDGGIQPSVREFEGRASDEGVPSFINYKVAHGTHVAGIVGSKSYGVAKNAKLVGVSILNGFGQRDTSAFMKALEFIVQEHRRRKSYALRYCFEFKGSTANISLGTKKTRLINEAVDAAVDAGIHIAVAAGNDGKDACNYSPASSLKVVTVGATDFYDNKAGFSNYGKCVDIFAPGVNIVSTWANKGSLNPLSWIGFEGNTKSLDGTSTAAPHVAGIMTYLLSIAPHKTSQYSVTTLLPVQMKKILSAIGQKDVIQGIPAGSQTPNILAYNGGPFDLSNVWPSWEQNATFLVEN